MTKHCKIFHHTTGIGFAGLKLVLSTIFACNLNIAAAAPSTASSQEKCNEFLALNKTAFHEVLRTGQHPAFGRIQQILDSRTNEQQAAIDGRLAQIHAEKEMTFQTKNVATQRYDKYVAVPVSGSIAPISERDYDRLVQSTADVMQTLRTLLQKIYSQRSLTIESLGLSKLPREEAEQALRAIKRSIYFEPKLVHPSMKDYPFLTMAGFDGAIVDPTNPRADFFEMNSGTPSGLSNNGMLLEALAQADPELFEAIRPYLPEDHTYTHLHQAVASSAHKWTGRRGLSVVISPGIYNGAHPDVAMIAKHTGMPLVRPSDLYEDGNGDIRLNIGDGENNPLVTGILNRNEESYLIQSNEENIPLIDPGYSDNAELGKKIGVKLRPGAIYDFKFDTDGRRIDVERNDDGTPRLQRVLDSMGRDPSRPNEPPGSFVRAVHRRRLYISNLGGRVVDHKSLFRIVTEYLVPNPNAKNLARPIKGLKISEYAKFYADPDSFVVKPPDNSGGSGIIFMVARTDEEKRQAIEEVRTHPGRYEIQYLSDLVTLPRLERNEMGELERNNVVIDWRIFVVMDGEGRVLAGPNSLLVRIAKMFSLYSNTSQGGGYGIGVVLSDNSVNPHQGVNPPKAPSASQLILASAADDMNAAVGLAQAKDILEDINRIGSAHPPDEIKLRHLALNLSFTLRNFVDRLEPDSLKFIGRLRDFAQSPNVSEASGRSIEIERGLIDLVHKLSKGQLRVNGRAEAFLSTYRSELPIVSGDPVEQTIAAMPTRARLRRLPPGDTPRLMKDESTEQRIVHQVELAEYLEVDSPEIQAIIDSVKEQGGQARLVKKRVAWANNIENPFYKRHYGYFWTRFWNNQSAEPSYMIPVLAIDLSDPRGLPAMIHEKKHFDLWMGRWRNYLAQGYAPPVAAELAETETWLPENVVADETECIAAEIAAELAHPNHPYNRDINPRPNEPQQRDYLNRIVYPHFQAVRDALYKVKRFKMSDEEVAARQAFAHKHMKEMILQASELRDFGIKYWQDRKGAEASATLKHFRENSVFDMLAKPWGYQRLENYENWSTLQEFQALMRTVLNELGMDEFSWRDTPVLTNAPSTVTQLRVLPGQEKLRLHQQEQQQ